MQRRDGDVAFIHRREIVRPGIVFIARRQSSTMYYRAIFLRDFIRWMAATTAKVTRDAFNLR